MLSCQFPRLGSSWASAQAADSPPHPHPRTSVRAGEPARLGPSCWECERVALQTVGGVQTVLRPVNLETRVSGLFVLQQQGVSQWIDSRNRISKTNH